MQSFIVAVAVAYAAWVVVARYAPPAVRRPMRRWTAVLARRAGWVSLAARIEAQASAGGSCGDGCGSCKGCGGSASAKSASGSSADNHVGITPEALRRTAAPFRATP
ncbi:MAG: DUF6587 family protein [Burkholderiaceae bacterium]